MVKVIIVLYLYPPFPRGFENIDCSPTISSRAVGNNVDGVIVAHQSQVKCCFRIPQTAGKLEPNKLG